MTTAPVHSPVPLRGVDTAGPLEVLAFPVRLLADDTDLFVFAASRTSELHAKSFFVPGVEHVEFCDLGSEVVYELQFEA